MAEAIVCLAIERISNVLIHEAGFLHGLEDEVSQLQLELKEMQLFLKDADFKQEKDECIRNWVAEIRNVVYEAEDAVDTFLVNSVGKGVGIASFINKLASIFTRYYHLHEMEKQIKSLHIRIWDVTNNLQAYGIKSICEEVGTSSTHLRRSHPHFEGEDVVVKLEITTWELMSKLFKEEAQVSIISIFGLGGIGKTTLAKKIYNSVAVKKHFDSHAWIVISQEFSLKDALYEVLTQVGSPVNMAEKEKDLIFKVYSVLKQKRYLVVIDDIDEIETLHSLKSALPNGSIGSKILFTTRNKEVAMHTDLYVISPIELPFLTDDESWKLFCSKVFAANILEQHSFLPEFEKLGKEMVKHCQGLPLAIVLLGGLLATKKSLEEWEAVQRKLELEISKSHHGVHAILYMSYHDLPFRLKPCFLYLSQFPEKKHIHKTTLIRNWIAEGFVSKPLDGEEDETIEDVAEQYLEELVSRCIVQVHEMKYTKVSIKSCHIHDLIRDMCLSKAREENFLGVIRRHVSDYPGTNQNLQLTTRRVAAHLSADRQIDIAISYIPMLEGVCSLYYFIRNNDYILMTKQQKDFVFKNFRLLRVLNLQKLIVIYLPQEIGNMIHLRYLGLRETELRGLLPWSIGDLKNLYTLDVRDNYWISFPNVFWKLESLRHLLVDRTVARRFRLDTLTELETLKWIKAKNLIRRDAMSKLNNIRNIGIEFEKIEEADLILNSLIFASGRLRSLKMLMLPGGLFPSLEPLSSCQKLIKAKLYGHILEDSNSLHHNLEFLPASLSKLGLFGSKLKQDPMVILEKLPNLRFLALDEDSYQGSKLVCSANGFPQLERLHIRRLKEVEEWIVEENAMKCLETLCIIRVQKLKMLPQGLKSITTLQQLQIFWMPEEFKNRIQVIDGEEGEDFDKIRHIPSISMPY